MHPDIIISVEKLRISFGNQTVVQNISFDLGRKKILALVGESGSGKSVTALAMLGLLPAQATVSGAIHFKPATEIIDLTQLKEKQWQEYRAAAIAMIFQEPMTALNPVMRVGKQLQETILQHKKISRTEAKKLATDWLGKVQIPDPEESYNKYPHQLSGGQKQRVMIAMAMCLNPDVLIADEPTTALDVTVQAEIIDLMKSLQQQYNTSIIFITHDLGLAASMADDMLVMYQGNIVEHGSTSAIFLHPRHDYTRALLACRPDRNNKGKQLITVQEMLEHKAGKGSLIEKQIPGDILLEVAHLKVYYEINAGLFSKRKKQFKAVDDIGFTIREGEAVGLVGESGCGKSTIGRSVMGLTDFQGTVLYKGRTIGKQLSLTEFRKEVQLIFQDPYASLNPRLAIGTILAEVLRKHKVVQEKEIMTEVKRLLSVVGLTADAIRKYPHEFSGGQRQRIGIARALALRPKLLICDESVSALDVSVQAQILNLLNGLRSSMGLAFLFISHDLNVVHYFCDRIIVMKAGVFVEENEAIALYEDPQHPYTQQLLAAIPDS